MGRCWTSHSPSPTWPEAGVQVPALGPSSGPVQPEVLPAVFSQFGDGATLGALYPALASCIAWSPPHARTVHQGSYGPGYRSLQELVPLPEQRIERPTSQVFKHRFKVGFMTPLCFRLGSVSGWPDGSCCIQVVLCFLSRKRLRFLGPPHVQLPLDQPGPGRGNPRRSSADLWFCFLVCEAGVLTTS